MFTIFHALLRDESGLILSAEAVVLGTVGVVGASVGLSSIAYSINEELKESAFSLRSLNQSYCIKGFSGHGSCTAGSSFTQKPVEEAHADLQLFIDDLEAELQQEAKADDSDDDSHDEAKSKSDKDAADNNEPKKKSRRKEKDARWDDDV